MLKKFRNFGLEMKGLKSILTGICLGCALAASCAMPMWEHIAPNRTYETTVADKVEVSVREGYIYVTTRRPVTVKLMSIVGQIISQQNLPAGVSRLKMKARGLYILKAGAYTTRVTV